jgi:hypothetical protein
VIQIGASPVTISELGRWKLSGNSQVNTVKIVQENNVNLPGALVTVTMANGPVGTFVYTALPAPVTLEANKAYYLVTSVTDQGDTWYDWNQPVSSTGGVSIVSTVWAPPGGGYSRYGAGSSSYGQVGLKSDPTSLVTRTNWCRSPREPTAVRPSSTTGKGVAGSSEKKSRARPGGSLLRRPAMSMTACG